TIIEVYAVVVEIGAITGGGRYDNLTGVFGVPGLSGVGISFGADRIYDVLNALNLYPEEISGSVKALFINFGKDEARAAQKCIKDLRRNGISAQLYPDAAKIKKQMQFANAEGVQYVVMIGEEELANHTATVKNMTDGSQSTVEQSKLADVIC
ncbi:MAG: histidine--tRNA ligase, partial [Muribaculaceae bacterium]|nr:histidine--tRNA ligase [Muribaculaceae bacterium]